MKKYLLISLLLVVTSAFAKPLGMENGYHPMLEVGKVWNYTYHSQNGDQEMSIEVKGDTVIDNKNCHKIYLCLPDSRYLYGCYYEDENGSVFAYMMLDIRKEDGKLAIKPRETASSVNRIYIFRPKGVSCTYAWGNSYYVEIPADIVIRRSRRYDINTVRAPYPISPSRYELISVNDNCFARVQITDVQEKDTVETWVSGVGERYWGIMFPIAGIGKDDGGEWIEFESCEMHGQRLFAKEDFDAEALHHDYRPFVEDNKTWTCYGNTEGAALYYLYLRGDTLINDQQCLKFYSQNRYNDGTTRYEGALYEKDKRVYRFEPNSSQASLLYDFSLKQGEEALLWQGDWYGYLESDRISAITDTYELSNGQLFRIMLFYEVEDWGEDDIYYLSELGNWIEGVGPGFKIDVLYFWGVFNIIGNGYGYGIIDCSVNGKSIYRTDYYDRLTSSIQSPVIDRTKDAQSGFYDLQGRRLTTQPTKGIYIQNGKKHVVK